MGQALVVGAATGAIASLSIVPMKLSWTVYAGCFTSCCGAGLFADMMSDAFATEGKIRIEKEAVINASDVLEHVSSFYAPCNTHPISEFLGQKHEWLVLENSSRFYTIQKHSNGDISMDVRPSKRMAIDLGLKGAGRATLTGETELFTAHCKFDLPNDLQVAYLVAWLRKEDPRWSLTTENSKNFCYRLRKALNDF